MYIMRCNFIYFYFYYRYSCMQNYYQHILGNTDDGRNVHMYSEPKTILVERQDNIFIGKMIVQ